MTTWNNKRKTYHIGIDTGRNTGIAIWCSDDKKLIDVKTVKVHTAMDIVRQYAQGHDVTVWVEDARKAVHGRQNDYYKLKGAGSIMRDAVIWEDFLTDLGVLFHMVRPKKGLTKLTKQDFAKITGYTGITSNHSRDAAMMVYGR